MKLTKQEKEDLSFVVDALGQTLSYGHICSLCDTYKKVEKMIAEAEVEDA